MYRKIELYWRGWRSWLLPSSMMVSYFATGRHDSIADDVALRHLDHAGNEALRTHFIQLTEKMLSPLNRYVASLIPPVG